MLQQLLIFSLAMNILSDCREASTYGYARARHSPTCRMPVPSPSYRIQSSRWRSSKRPTTLLPTVFLSKLVSHHENAAMESCCMIPWTLTEKGATNSVERHSFYLESSWKLFRVTWRTHRISQCHCHILGRQTHRRHT